MINKLYLGPNDERTLPLAHWLEHCAENPSVPGSNRIRVNHSGGMFHRGVIPRPDVRGRVYPQCRRPRG